MSTFIAFGSFFLGFIISRWISNNAIESLEPHQKEMLVNISTRSPNWLPLATVFAIFVPKVGFIIFAMLVLTSNLLNLRRIWASEVPEFFKRSSLTATIIYSAGVLTSAITLQYIFYLTFDV